MKQDTFQRYGSVTRFFHWLVAALVLNQFFKFADRINDGEHWLGETFGPYHVSIGAAIMIFALFRLIWRKRQTQRPTNEGFLGVIANLSHKVMYFCMLVMPPLGAIYIVGHGYPVSVFGFTLIPKPAGEIAWAQSIGQYHSVLAFVLVFLVVAHFAAALYHHFIRQDGVLKRMV